jgi:CBS domain-containing protein
MFTLSKPSQNFSGASMKPISKLLKNRDSSVFQVEPSATVFEALQLLSNYGVGAMIVMEKGKLVGIVSERDYTRKVALQGKNSKETKVADIMTSEIVSVTPQTGIRDCMTLMSQKKIRHLPVVDGTTVMGMISIRDIMDDIIADHEETISQLTTYIST